MKATLVTFLSQLLADFPALEQGLVVEQAGEHVLELWPNHLLRSSLPIGTGKSRYVYLRLAKPMRFEANRPMVACGTPM